MAHQASGAARKLCSDLVNRIGLLRAVEASEVQERAANASAMGLEGRRRREVGGELKRISQHSGAFIKTSVWHGGVSQRVATQQLYEGLSKEFLALRAVVKDLGRRLSEADVHVVGCRPVYDEGEANLASVWYSLLLYSTRGIGWIPCQFLLKLFFPCYVCIVCCLQASLRRRRLVFETQLIHAERLRDLLETALLRATALNLDDLVNQVTRNLLETCAVSECVMCYYSSAWKHILPKNVILNYLLLYQTCRPSLIPLATSHLCLF